MKGKAAVFAALAAALSVGVPLNAPNIRIPNVQPKPHQGSKECARRLKQMSNK